MSKKARVFVPLCKVDEEQRLVYGRITQEILDKSGEVMDYTTSKPFFQKWSDEANERSGGLSKGNVRVMHGLSVAGKLTDIAFDDDEKAIDVCAKVVDDQEWTKVLEGCYTGFSVGGKYEKRWTDSGVRKYTAGPNEVSLVDNPCVETASFALVKADGVEEQVMFKIAEPEKTEEPETPEVKEPVEEVQSEFSFTNDQVIEKATAIAAAAADGTSWMDHITTARDELVKSAPKKTTEEPTPEVTVEAVEEPVEKTTPAGVKQVWTASDGKTFEKKADAEAHETSLIKAAVEPTEAEALAARLEKALKPETKEPIVVVGLWEDFGRLGKAVAALSTPFEDGKPKLEKGMYTVNRFSHVLSDLASLAKSIQYEGTQEGGDSEDSTVSADIKTSLGTLAKSFLDYTREQVTELLAGVDDEVCVSYYDYYYNAAKENGEDELAKDVCSIITELRDPSREVRDTMAKAFGMADPVEIDELTPTLQKRFDDLTAENATFKKVAEQAVEKVEELAKRVQEIEDTPMPRAPNPALLALREGDSQLFGKTVAGTHEERLAIVHDLIKTHGADGVALEMIKFAHAAGGQKLTAGR